MGLIVDTCVLIEAERKGQSSVEIFDRLSGLGEVAIAAITLMELSEGIAIAKDVTTAVRRRNFLQAVRQEIPVIPMTSELAVAAGLLNGQLRVKGVTIGLADSIIAATALSEFAAVATLNGKHFKAVPGLNVVEL
jgi:tRNA(fMet)-specific endonuclease VapC